MVHMEAPGQPPKKASFEVGPKDTSKTKIADTPYVLAVGQMLGVLSSYFHI